MSEMADIWQNQFACPGNESRHTIRILALDEFIAVAVHYPSGHLDAAQLFVREVRLAVPHRLHLFWKRFVFPGSRGELLIFLFTSAEVIVKEWVLVHILCASGIGIRPKREQFRQPLRMVDGDVKPDDPAITPAHKSCFWDVQSIHDGKHVGSHQVIRDWFAVTGAATMTTAIQHDDFVLPRTNRNL